ncbi:MAG: electron transfer flavoprotein subunit beta/FixA family protein [Micrococcales bacterium]|nr:electron transfer flavoprotein subunit beta/FixA family protein [Micrococcales bacterium]
MTNVLVCIKRVPDSSEAVTLTPDGRAVDGRYSGYTMSPHEECAIEIAASVAGATGGTVTVLTLGTDEAEEQLRYALSVGAKDAILIEGDPDDFGPRDVADAIAEAIRTREADGTPVDLVLVGNDAADTGDFQVGIRLAHLLGRPVCAGIKQVEVDGDVAVMTGDGPEGTEVYEVALPAVATILEGGVEPRYPSITGRMKARKAPVARVTPSGSPRGTGRVVLTVPAPPPSEVTVLGTGAAAAPAVVAMLKELGVTR